MAPQPLEPIHPADLLKPSVEPKVDGSQDIGSNSSSLSDLDLVCGNHAAASPQSELSLLSNLHLARV